MDYAKESDLAAEYRRTKRTRLLTNFRSYILDNG